MEWRLYPSSWHPPWFYLGGSIILLCTAWIGLNSTCGCTLNFCFVDPQRLPWLQQRHHKKLENKTINFSSMGFRYFNEVPTLLLILIVTLAVFRNQTNPIYLTLSTLAVVALIIAFTLLYKKYAPSRDSTKCTQSWHAFKKKLLYLLGGIFWYSAGPL